MAFSSTAVAKYRVTRTKSIAVGTFTNGASTDSGGEISTGLKSVDTFVWACSSHLGTEPVKVTKNSSSAGKVTIVTSTGAVTGDWIAFGT